MSDELTLSEFRMQIDAIDADLLRLISERAEIVKSVGHFKMNLEDDTIAYRPEREAQILRKVMESNTGPLSDQKMASIFRQIISVCMSLEQTLKVAYLGPEGTFTQIAAINHFGEQVKMTALNAIDQVFDAVSSSACHYGVVPIENSIEGVVNHTLDMFIDSNLCICGEIEISIHHHLLSHVDSIHHIVKVFSHQQSLAQCRIWLDRHLSGAERIAVSSNAEAVRIVAKEKDCAAIAGESAAELYRLPILARNLESQADNTTRFLVLGRQGVAPSGQDKTSLLLTAPTTKKPGTLQAMLACFSDNGVNLTRIESRPSRKGVMWDYVFFVDIEGHADNPEVQRALQQLRDHAAMVKLLGSYPRAVC